MIKFLFSLVVLMQLNVYTKAQSDSLSNKREGFQKPNSILLSLNESNRTTGDKFSKEQDNQALNKKKWLVLATAGLGVTTYFFLDEPLQEFAQWSRNDGSNKVFEVIEPLGRSKYLVPAAGAALIGGLVAKNKRMRDVGVIGISSILANCVISDVLKQSFRRHRPSVSYENDQFDGPFLKTTNSSMPSSHTSTAFALATSVAYVYKDVKIVPPVAYGLAALVGISRVHDNAHWTTDVVAGAAVGYLTSKGMIYLHKKIGERFEKRKQKLSVTFSPIVAPQTFGLSSTITF